MSSLESLAKGHFTDLTVAEGKLIEAAPIGQFAFCGPNENDFDPANHPRTAGNWGNERQIRAKLIRWLCRDPIAKVLIDPKGLQVYGAKLTGVLDLSQVRVPFPLALIHCRLTEDLLLRATEIPLIVLDGSWVCAVKADGVDVKGGVALRHGFRAERQVRFHRARIGVDLDCGGGTFINPSRRGSIGSALGADGATFGGGIFINNGFHAEGEVRFSRAQVRGDLDCSGGTFHNGTSQIGGSESAALNADGINVSGSIFLRGIHCEGEVRLPRAKVEADIDCGGAKDLKSISMGPCRRGGGHDFGRR